MGSWIAMIGCSSARRESRNGLALFPFAFPQLYWMMLCPLIEWHQFPASVCLLFLQGPHVSLLLPWMPWPPCSHLELRLGLTLWGIWFDPVPWLLYGGRMAFLPGLPLLFVSCWSLQPPATRTRAGLSSLSLIPQSRRCCWPGLGSRY